MAAVSHRVGRELEVSIERIFDTVVAEDVLPLVLSRWGPIPGVTGTRDLTGPWDTPGSERTVVLSGGATAREQVLSWERPRRFEYRVDQFASPLGRLADHATGSWEFSETARGSRFDWTYSFESLDALGGLVLRPFVRIAWARYMEQCASRCVALATNAG